MNLSRRRELISLSALLALAAAAWITATIADRPASIPSPTLSPLSPDCTQMLVEVLAQAGLVGKATFQTDGTLAVEILPSAESTVDQAAQLFWVTFDGVSTLPPRCPYPWLEVTVVTGQARLHARVAAADLRAWAEGTLTDSGLIDRVFYTQQPLSPPRP